MNGQLHRIRMDVLLTALGGFAEEKITHSSGERYSKFTAADVDLARRYYEEFTNASGRLQYGRLAELAKRLNRDPLCLAAMLSYRRKRGEFPPIAPHPTRSESVPAPALRRYLAKPSPAPDRGALYLREWRAAAPITGPITARPDWFDEDIARLMGS